MKKIINKCIEIYKDKREIFDYLIIGVLTTLVNLVTKYGLLFTILKASDPKELQISIVISWIVAVIFAYVTNRKIVFRSKSDKILKEFVKFIEARLATLFIEMGYMWFFITFLKLNTNIWVIIWTISCQIFVIVLNYVFSKLFVFKKNKEQK